MTQSPTWKYAVALYRYLPKLATIHAVAWFLWNLTWLLPGWALSRLLDELSNSARFTDPMWLPLAALACYALIQSAMWLVGGYAETVMRYRVRGLMRTNVIERLLSRPVHGRNSISTGDAVNRVNEDLYAIEDLLDWSNEAWYGLGIGAFAFAMLMTIDVNLAVISVVPMIAVLVLTQIARSRLEHVREQSRSAAGSVSGAIGDMVEAATTLQAMAARERAVAHVAMLSEKRRRSAVIDQIATKALDAISVNIITLGTGIFMLLAARRITEQSLSVGQFTLFLVYLGVIADFAANFVMYLAHVIQTRVSIRRMNELVGTSSHDTLVRHRPIYLDGDLPANPDYPPVEPLRALAVKKLHSIHRDGAVALRDITFELERNTVTVVTGRIGSGKSALARTLLGQHQITGGQILWNDTPITDPVNEFVPPRVASIGQVPNLFSATLRANVTLGDDVESTRLSRAIHAVDLEPDLATMPHGLDTEIGTRGIKLSGGQMQRTAAARMLVRQSELLVIDDLSSALDVVTEKRLWSRLRELGDLTALVVSNRTPVLRQADQILVMAGGLIVDRGTFSELRDRSPEFRELLHEKETLTNAVDAD